MAYAKISPMKSFYSFVYFVVVLLVMTNFAGCSWIHHKTTSLSDEEVQFVETGKIVDRARLKEGGKILIVPFKAGPNVEADEYLDKVSLMIVKGLTDILETSDAQWQIIKSSEEASQADLIIEGHVTALSKPSKMNRMVMQHKKNLGVKGKMMDQKTGKTVLVFTDSKKTDSRKEDHKYLGFLIGQDVAKFILSRE